MKQLVQPVAFLLFCLPTFAQQPPVTSAPAPVPGGNPSAAVPAQFSGGVGSDVLLKRIDDVLWFTRISDIAEVDKIEYTSLPPAHVTNPKAPGATNPLIIHAYTFIPKNLDRSKKQPLLTFAHQGVHANFDTS